MNRRSFFGALVGGIAAATGVRRLIGVPGAGFGRDCRVLPTGYVFTTWDQLRRDLGMPPAQHFAFKPHFSVGRAKVDGFEAGDLSSLRDPQEGVESETRRVPVVGISGCRDSVAQVGLDTAHDVDQPSHQVGLVAGPTENQRRDERFQPRHAAEHAQSEVAVFHQSLPSEADTLPDFPTIWPGRSADITATVALPPLAQVERLVDLFGASGEEAPAFAAALIGELVLTRMRLTAADPKTLWGLEVLP